MQAVTSDNLNSKRIRRNVGAHVSRQLAFSMTEMVFAIFILGLGLLFTSSMFPIAWFKAREVFETTNTQSCTAAAQDAFHRVSKINGPNDLANTVSTFFPIDWFPIDRNDPTKPAVFPDTRVHVMGLGNFLASPRLDIFENDGLNPGGDDIPVASSSWELSDQLAYQMSDSAFVGGLTLSPLVTNRPYTTNVYARDRMFPPLERRPDASVPTNQARVELWDEQFEGRRYCWATLYRFSRMYGPNVSTDPLDPFRILPNCGGFSPPAECGQMVGEIRETLAKPREMTVYHVTLKRPDGARYARQEGLVASGGTASWAPGKLLDHPRALPPTSDVLLPSPWRFEASLTVVPAIGAPPSGIPSEVMVDDAVLAEMLAPKTVLIDERNGQIYRVTQRRNVTGSPTAVVLVLDKEYTSGEVHRPDYTLFPKNYSGNQSLHSNWLNTWEWIERNCDNLDLTDGSIPNVSDCLNIAENEPQKRYYWVFPPPVEVDRAGNGIPIFDGSPTVVDIQTRQVVLRPRQ
ncbi:MAG: hypothetical protein KDA54_20515 [Phycisphaerales bacterium]|nr:hypothetical protein [Phycisphaerales bacterium]